MYVCPTCNKNYLSEASVERVWSSMELAVENTPMPPEYQNMLVRPRSLGLVSHGDRGQLMHLRSLLLDVWLGALHMLSYKIGMGF